MTNTINEFAETLSNISDMTIEESMTFLLKVEGEFVLENEQIANSLDIANLLNEASNDHIITVQQLADSLIKLTKIKEEQRPPLENLIKYTIAIGETTRDTGKVIGNSLKGYIGRIPSMIIALDKETLSLLEDNGVDVNHSSKDVIDILASKWGTFTKKQQEDFSEKIAGKYQLSRFSVLMSSLSPN